MSVSGDMARARARETVRNKAEAVRKLAKNCRDSDTLPVGVIMALDELADAVELLADVSESQDGGES